MGIEGGRSWKGGSPQICMQTSPKSLAESWTACAGHVSKDPVESSNQKAEELSRNFSSCPTVKTEFGYQVQPSSRCLVNPLRFLLKPQEDHILGVRAKFQTEGKTEINTLTKPITKPPQDQSYLLVIYLPSKTNFIAFQRKMTEAIVLHYIICSVQ